MSETQEALLDIFKQLKESLTSSRRSQDDVALPIFNPAKTDTGAAGWCTEIEALGKEFKWSSNEQVARAGKVLQGEAKSWFENWEPTQRDWTNFQAAIIDLFPPKRNLSEKLRRAVLLSSDNYETYCEYAREKLMLFKKTKIQFSENELVDLIIGDIRETPVRMGALNSGVNTTSNLLILLSGHTKISRKRPSEFQEASPGPSISKKPKTTKSCYFCGKVGHLQAQCTKLAEKNSRQTSKNLSAPTRREPSTNKSCTFCHKQGHQVETCWAKQRADRDAKVNFCERTNIGKDLTLVIIRGKPINCLIDTGSECSIISEQTVLKTGCHIEPHLTRLTGLGHKTITTVGKTRLVVECEDIALEVDFFIVRDTDVSYEAILGKDIFRQNDVTFITDKDGTRIVSHASQTINTESRVCILTHEEIGSHLCVGDHEKLQNLLRQHSAMITTGNKVRPILTAEMDIKLKNYCVINYRPYRLSLTEKEKLRTIISDLKENAIIRDSQSSFASPVILVKKKDGSDRLCVDYRALNRATINDRYPLPLIDDQLDRLVKNKYFTTLDMAAGFHQIPIAKNSIHKTAFVTPEGHYEYLRMPFGLSNAPAVFQRAIHNALGSLKDTIALVYLDDVLIPSETISEGLAALAKILTALDKTGFSLNLKKCRFFEEKLEYLGREISAEGIRPSENKVKALVESLPPENIRQVRQFMGLAGYFRKFIPEFSSKTACITKLTKKNEPWVWSEEQINARNYVLDCLSDRPLLAVYDPKLPTEVHTDASAIGFGAILFQKHADGLRVVAYYSRRASREESKYHSYELETLAIVYALKHFRVYLVGITFKLVTDCNAIKATAHKKDLLPRVARWWMFLQDFNFDVEYRKGKYVAHVDYLSRNPPITPQPRVNVICEGSWLEVEQSKDPETQNLIERVNTGEPIISDYAIKNSLLCRKVLQRNGNFILKYYVPKRCRFSLLRLYHDEQCHTGYDKTLHKIRERFWFPRMGVFVKKYIAHCLVCVSTKKLSGPKQGFLHSIEKKPIPFHTIHIDCVGPFKVTSEGYKHTLLIVDSFTKFVVLIPLKSLTGKESLRALQPYLTLFGTPVRVISDQGTNFTDKQLSEFLKTLNIEHHKIATGASRANGQVERYVATVISYLATEINKVSEWSSALPKIQLTLNSTIQKTTGFSPLRLLIGIDCNNTSIQSLVNSLPVFETTFVDVAKERALAYDNLQRNAVVQKERFDRVRRDTQNFVLGDYVFIPKSNARAGKLEPQFRGLYKIIEVLPRDRYRAENKKFKRGPLVVPKDRIKLWPGEWSETEDDDVDPNNKIARDNDMSDPTTADEPNNPLSFHTTNSSEVDENEPLPEPLNVLLDH